MNRISRIIDGLWGIVLIGALCLSKFSFSGEPDSIYADLIDDPFPVSVPSVQIGPESFKWIGLEKLPTGTQVEFLPESIQWSRIRERLVLPRARMRIEIPDVEGAQLEIQSRVIPLRRSLRGSSFGEAVVPLTSGSPSTVDIRFKKNGVMSDAKLTLERTTTQADLIGVDHSCSPWGVELTPRDNFKSEKKGGLVILNCKILRAESTEGMVAVLDLLLFIDGSGDSMKVNGVLANAEASSVFRLRLSTQAQPFIIETNRGESYDLKARVPAKLNRGFFGMGIGPYQYEFFAPGTSVNTTTGIITAYVSYQMAETVKLTAFNATAIHQNFFSDTGFYFKTNSAQFFDQRMSGYLMLGANLVGYKYADSVHYNFGAPQGFEAIYHDFLGVNKTMTIGGFIYPPIDGKSYYNGWLRYGAPGFFIELNYLSIRTRFEGDEVGTKSVGASIGFPLAKFF